VVRERRRDFDVVVLLIFKREKREVRREERS
jgi:hypothetical protein